MKNTHIQWCDHTFNPWIGCTKVDELCVHCYAETRDKRFAGGVHWGKGAARSRTSEHNWREPFRWNAEAQDRLENSRDLETPRPRVFCASLADWLDEEVPIEWLASLVTVIVRTPFLDWLLLTKRPENWKDRLAEVLNHISGNWPATMANSLVLDWIQQWVAHRRAPANVWFGVSAGSQKTAELHLPTALQVPAAIHFLSAEPLLGAMNLSAVRTGERCEHCGEFVTLNAFGSCVHCACCVEGDEGVTSARLDWIICGGESGPGCRPMELTWARLLRAEAKSHDVPFFMKQLGGVSDKRGLLKDLPADLAFREFP